MPNRGVVSEHAEDAAFVWTQRDAAVLSPSYNLRDISELDERIEANLAGLRLAGDLGWEICEDNLAMEGPGETFVAGVLALESRDASKIEKVLDVASYAYPLERAFVSAFGWLPFPSVTWLINRWITSPTDNTAKRISIAAAAVHRQDAKGFVTSAMGSSDAMLCARASKSTGELGRQDLLLHLQKNLSSQDERVRFQAAWSIVRLGRADSSTLAVLQKIAEGKGPYSERALQTALLSLTPGQGLSWYQSLRADPGLKRLAALAVGFIGDPALVGDLFPMMEDDEIARAAGASLTNLTGVNLDYEDLVRDDPTLKEEKPVYEEEEAEADEFAQKKMSWAEQDDDAEEELVDDLDEYYDWPDAALARAWWDAQRGNYQSGLRYLAGKEADEAGLRFILREGRQNQRNMAAFLLGRLDPSKPLFEVRAKASSQTAELQP